MKKQYCLEWYTKKGNDGFKSLGYDLTDAQCEKEMMRKLKQRTTESVCITWNYVGNDIPDEEIGKDYYLMGGRKNSFEVLGSIVYIENDYQIWKEE